MINTVSIEPRGNLDAETTVPGSKSCTARALIMAGLARGRSTLIEPADCDDSDRMVDGLRALGRQVEKAPGQLLIDGGPFIAPSQPIMLGNSGTAVRFLAAACATLEGCVVLDGDARMRERPIKDLVDALSLWGVQASAPTGCPPLTIVSSGRFGGAASVRGTASSQYLSGLLMVAPYASSECTISIEGELVSKPYVDLTLAMMRERGVSAGHDDYRSFRVPHGQCYEAGTYPIEADASGASYFLAAAAVAGGRVRVLNLTTQSQQGDAQFARILERMGCGMVEGLDWLEISSGRSLSAIDVDLNAMPDMAQTLAVTALFARGTTRIRNVGNLRIKETDRISAAASELRKLGATVQEFDDGLEITPGELRAAEIDTYNDHRMAMSFALAGLRIPGIRIRNPECVSKTFPDFFTRFAALR